MRVPVWQNHDSKYHCESTGMIFKRIQFRLTAAPDIIGTEDLQQKTGEFVVKMAPFQQFNTAEK